MTDKKGYFALWRKFQEHPFWKEKRKFSKAEAWIDMLWEATHQKEGVEVIIGMNHFTCHYGELLKSVRTWAKRWGWSESTVFRFFKLLEKMGQIRNTNETVTTRVTLLNYSKYDPRNHQGETDVERSSNAGKTQAVTNKNVKNIRKKKEILKKERNTSFFSISYPDWLDLNLWKEFKKHRVQMKSRMTEEAEKRNIAKLKKLMDEGFDQEAIIGQSIERGWKAFFPIKKSENGGKTGRQLINVSTEKLNYEK